MAQYIEVEQARSMPGLRVVLTPGVPGPWSESAKGILHVKKLSYVKARQEILGANVALIQWSAQATAPVAALNDEPPRATWIEQLFLFERIAPQPRLIPHDFDERVLMFGLANEICGEQGFGWNKRNIMVRDHTQPGMEPRVVEFFTKLGNKYGYTSEDGKNAPSRCAEILTRLASRLQEQRTKGSKFFIGNGLTALDIYWACFVALIKPLPNELCPMPPDFRTLYTNTDPVVAAAAAPILFEHRDFIYKNFLELPVDC
jgi:glutathione S-transferase